MSFQAYLDAIEKRTGTTPQRLVEVLRLDGIANRDHPAS